MGNGHHHWTEKTVGMPSGKLYLIFDDKILEKEHIFFLMKESRIGVGDAVYFFFF